MELKPIGIIYSNYKNKGEAPKQGRLSDETQKIEIFKEYSEGLKDIDKHKYLIILYWQDKSIRTKLLTTTPFSLDEEKGVFSTRSPNRPNPIALCIAEVIDKKENLIIVKGLDALNGSYLIDIKPYIYELDCISIWN